MFAYLGKLKSVYLAGLAVILLPFTVSAADGDQFLGRYRLVRELNGHCAARIEISWSQTPSCQVGPALVVRGWRDEKANSSERIAAICAIGQGERMVSGANDRVTATEEAVLKNGNTLKATRIALRTGFFSVGEIVQVRTFVLKTPGGGRLALVDQRYGSGNMFPRETRCAYELSAQ